MNYLKSTVAAGLALAVSGAFAQASPTSATVTQTGVGNQAYVDQNQASEGSTVSIVQTGNYNMVGDPASRTGGILLHDTPGMIVAVSQMGDANRLTLQHINEGGLFGFAYINQAGTGNAATLLQNGAYESTIRVEQHGERNMIEDIATEVGAVSFRPEQHGSDNVITVRRNWSGYAGLPIYQEGTANRATVTYDDAFYSGMSISQIGTGNEARGSLASTGFATEAAISQNGVGNLAITNVYAAGGAATTQTGNANTATVNQNSGSNGATISQLGALNTATVTQAGPLSDTPNVAWITQIGEGFAAGITQTGSGNHAGIYQH